jgi:endonuclease/exonuclease/phosphatase family metal-dependent hydrolase
MIRNFFLAILVLAPATVTADDSFKVVSYNIRYASPGDGEDIWANRADAVAAVIADHDIAGLQEVTHPQLLDLQDILKDYETYSIGRNDGKTSGEHTSILYRRDRFEATDQGTFWLSETPNEAGSKSWDAAITRICSWVIFRDKQTDQEFYFANTHFDHRGSKARLESGKLIQQTILRDSKALPVILMGDFNCLPDSGPYKEIVTQSAKPLVDVRALSKSPPAGPNSTWCGFKKIAPDRIIDHVFVAGRVNVESVTVLNPKTDKDGFASDHLPVQVLVSLEH